MGHTLLGIVYIMPFRDLQCCRELVWAKMHEKFTMLTLIYPRRLVTKLTEKLQ